MGDHRRAVPLDQEMSGPGEQIADPGPDQRDHRIDGDEAGDQRERAEPGADHMQNARAALRVMAEIMLPELIEAFARHPDLA
ncbi:MAG TPA: hypothetical protein VF340_05825 [Methyloceanibacter sp.]